MYEAKSHHISFVTQASEFCKFSSQSTDGNTQPKMDLMMEMKTFSTCWQQQKPFSLGQCGGCWWCADGVYCVKIVWHLLLNKDIIYVKSFTCTVKYNVTNTARVTKWEIFRQGNNIWEIKEEERAWWNYNPNAIPNKRSEAREREKITAKHDNQKPKTNRPNKPTNQLTRISISNRNYGKTGYKVTLKIWRRLQIIYSIWPSFLCTLN